MPFSSAAAAELRVEIDGQTTDARGGATLVSGRAVVNVHRATAVHSVRIEFVGEESVSLRAWVPLGTTTQTREIVKATRVVRTAGVLAVGTHEYGFVVRVPWWVPSTLDRDMCRIQYVARVVVERASLASYLGASSSASSNAWTGEKEVECRHVRTSRRLARRKRVDQSVGCPDGSCHVRVWGSVSRDVVKPGAQLRLDLAARTSDGRFGLRLLAAHFAECVICHVQVKGEERMVNRITNLATCRLDALDCDESNAEEDAGSEDIAVQPGQLARGIRKTRSRLAVLLRNAGSTSPQPPVPPVHGSGSGSVPGSPPPLSMQPPPRVVRQVRASQIVQVPSGLSAFASELVSREYRLVVVAAVAPLEPTAATDSVHTNDSARLTYQPQHARSAHNLGTTRSSSSSAASAASGASLLGGTRYSEGARYSEGTQPTRRRRRRSESGIAPQQPQWSVSERSSAIAAWTIDVVDHFDVQFDELVSPEYGSADPPAAPRSAAPLAEVEVLAGEYAFVPPSPVMSPSSTPSPERPPSQERASHHRRTSSGLVGFLMRGFRSSASSPTTSAPASSPTTSAPAAPVSMSAVSPSTRHVRSMSGADSHPRANNNRGSDKVRKDRNVTSNSRSEREGRGRQPRVMSNPPQRRDELRDPLHNQRQHYTPEHEQDELVMYPLMPQRTLD